MYQYVGSSLAVQWLGLGAFTAVVLGSIPDWGTEILQAMQAAKKKKIHVYQYVLYGVPEAEEREKRTESVFEKIMVETFPNLMKNINLHI